MRINQILTVTAGTPVNIGTGKNASDNIPRYASRFHAQMVSGTHVGYLLAANYLAGNRVPSSANGSDLVVQLAPASATGPGVPFEDFESLDRGGIDMTELWIDGANTGDQILVSYVPKT